MKVTIGRCLRHNQGLRVDPRQRDLNAKDTDKEEALFSCDITTKVLVKMDFGYSVATMQVC